MTPDDPSNPSPTAKPNWLARLRRRQTAYRDIWLGRLILWTGAVGIGLLAVLFAKLTEEAVSALRYLNNEYPGWVFISAPLGGALIVWLTRRFFSGAEGSGIPQVMAEMAQHGSHSRLPKPLLSLRIVFAKITLGVGAIFAGFSTGREGPMVQIGAALMHAIGERLPKRLQVSRHHLLAAGGAAGIAAAFNTPLAGILFAIEELSRGIEDRMSGLILTAIVIAGIVAQAYFGNYTYFGWLNTSGLENPHPIGLMLAAALLCGVAGGLFARLSILAASGLPGRLGHWRAHRPIWFAAGCGLAIAIIGWISGDLTYGTGYGEAKHMLMNPDEHEIPWHFGLDKFAATLISFASGVPGGIFAPSLSVGAGLGQNLHFIAGDNDTLVAMASALCMAGFLAAVTQAPITAFVIVMEMIDGYELVIDLMIVAMLASVISRAISPPLYRSLAALYLRHAINTTDTPSKSGQAPPT